MSFKCLSSFTAVGKYWPGMSFKSRYLSSLTSEGKYLSNIIYLLVPFLFQFGHLRLAHVVLSISNMLMSFETVGRA